ncbi:MAG: hypothetical protein Q8O88_03705 [bacterium]|nr:hypothetical protein [bacterium]
MSTRANIIIKDGDDKLFFYRHSDGYPEGVMPTLKKFLALVKKGKIRDNVGQAAGWLILLGAMEYQTIKGDLFPEHGKPSYEQDEDKVDKAIKDFSPSDWKVGAYEPTTCIHDDIEWLYTIDLQKKTLTKEKR